jgi:hypothetical protein
MNRKAASKADGVEVEMSSPGSVQATATATGAAASQYTAKTVAAVFVLSAAAEATLLGSGEHQRLASDDTRSSVAAEPRQVPAAVCVTAALTPASVTVVQNTAADLPADVGSTAVASTGEASLPGSSHLAAGSGCQASRLEAFHTPAADQQSQHYL